MVSWAAFIVLPTPQSACSLARTVHRARDRLSDFALDAALEGVQWEREAKPKRK